MNMMRRDYIKSRNVLFQIVLLKKKKKKKKTVDSVALSLNRNTICCIGSITSSTTQNTSSSEANKIERQMKKKNISSKVCMC